MCVMCCYPAELFFIPLLTVTAALLYLVAMSSKNWLEAYIQDNPPGAPYLFGQLSPWYLCAAECTQCPPQRRKLLDCFWMRDWAGTGFGILAVIQHLEYWCLGCLVLSLFPSLMTCLDRRVKTFRFNCKKPAIILIVASCVLSLVALLTFVSGHYGTLDDFAEGHALHRRYAWPFYLRVLASVLMFCSCGLALGHQYRGRSGYMMTKTEEETFIVMPVGNGDYGDQYTNFGDPV